MARTPQTSTAASPSLLLDRLIDSKRLGRRLRCTLQTLHNWRTKAGMPFIRMGIGRGAIRFDILEVEKWITSRSLASRKGR